MKRAIIVGCEGQDGKLAFDYLLKNSYRIIGIDKGAVRCASAEWDKAMDINSTAAVAEMINNFKPEEVYYFAAYHNSAEDKVKENIELFADSYKTNLFALINFLEAIKNLSLPTRLFYAASSLIYEETSENIQNENTPFAPASIYGITKLSGLLACRYYKNNYRIFASAGILYNHESKYRNENYVSKKIIKGALNIKNKKQDKLILGDLSSEADWGYAPDYVEAIYKILQLEKPDEFVVATGVKHSVREFVQIAFDCLDMDWKMYIEENNSLIKRKRKPLVGDSSKLMSLTGWQPSVSFTQMIKLLLKDEEAEIL